MIVAPERLSRKPRNARAGITTRPLRRQQGEVGRDEPLFVISVAARMAGLHAQTLRHYERVGLVAPARSDGNVRLYSARDVERVRRIRSLMEDLGVNLAGVEVILRLRDRISALADELSRLKRS